MNTEQTSKNVFTDNKFRQVVEDKLQQSEMAPKRYRDNLSDHDTDQEDCNVEGVEEILDGFEANVFDSNEEKCKILQDRHKTLEQSSKAKKGARGTKFAKKCKAKTQVRYKRRNGIIKSMKDLKVVTANDSLSIFLKHPVDNNSSNKTQMFATTRELIQKYKDAPFHSTITECTSRFFDEAPSSQELRMATNTN